jgi:hypothetical protein
MSTTQITLRGTVRADGTLDLETPVSLPPGPVRVTINPVSSHESNPARRSLAEVLQEIDAGQQARGYRGSIAEEMEADAAQRRAEDEEYEERWRAIWGETTSGPAPEGPP